MNYDFEWFDVQVGTPIVSVANYGLTFSRSAVLKMGTPEYVMLGFDKTNKIIAIKVCDDTERMKISFASKERNGNVRISNKDFVRYIASNIDDASTFDKNAIRYTGLWDEENKLMIVDLKRPIKSEDSEETESNEVVTEQ